MRATATTGNRPVFTAGPAGVKTPQVFVVAQSGVGGLEQQKAQQPVALLGDVAEALGVAAGMFFGIQATVRGDAPGAIEARDRLEGVHHRQRRQQTSAGMGAQPYPVDLVLRAGGQFILDGPDLRGQRFQQHQGMLALGGKRSGQRQRGELPVKTAPIASLMMERALVHLSVGRIAPQTVSVRTGKSTPM